MLASVTTSSVHTRVGRRQGPAISSPTTNEALPSERVDFTPKLDAAWSQAGELMSSRGISLEDRTLMRENIATYLTHAREGHALPTGRWENKLEQDLKSPYTDHEVLQHADKLQTSLLENLRQLPEYPKEIYITGSFSKGRLRTQSDLNGYAPVSSENFFPTFQLFSDRFQNKDTANLFPLSHSQPNFNKGMLTVDGSSLLISTSELEQPGYLSTIYRERLQEGRPNRWESSSKLDPWLGKAWRSKFEREPLHYRLMRTAVAIGGALTRTPLIGASFEKAASRIVTQEHRNLT